MEASTSMRQAEADIEFAKGLARAHHQRHATLDGAITLFEEAATPEARAEAASNLMAVSEEAEVNFRESMNRINALVTTENRQLAILAGSRDAFGGPGA